MRSFLTLALGLYLLPVSAQTFETTAAAPITDQATLVSPLVVFGLPDSLKSEGFGLEAVCLHVEHESVNRLIITLFAPDGTRVKLTHLNGRDEADHLTNTCFGEEGKYFPLEHPPYYGGYQPVLPLGVVNNGQNPNGVWRLMISEFQGEDYEGQLVQWSLTFGKHPARYDTILSDSQLPILSFDTHGNDIPTDPKITARLRIADHAPDAVNRSSGPFNGFDGPVGIELHGSSSATFWQQSFSFETRDAQGDDLDVPLLGLPAGSDWVLHGPFSDKSLLRNALTFALADAATQAYVPRARFCEVVLNGSYLGVYTLLEKIKRGSDRVDIDKLRQSDVSGDALTGGYIIKVDRKDAPGWHSTFKPAGGGSVYFNYVEPKAADLQPVQMAYIQAFVDSFEQALACPEFDDPEKGWRQFADEASFVEYFLFQEASKNVDAYRLSGHLFKPRNGTLHAGPLWDFNLAWRNANYVGNEVPVGWTFEGEPYGVPFWWEKLLQDAGFVEKLRCRWHVLRQTVLSQRHIFSVIDSLATTLEAPQKRHYDLYPIMGRGIWPNPTPIAKTYAQEIDEMKYWISQRLLWMDARLPGGCGSAVAPAAWVVYPNPVHDQLTVFFEARPPDASVLELVDMTGRVVVQQTNLVFETVLEVQQVEKGFYLLCYRDKTGQLLRVEKIIRL
jgi:subtilisin-like proprotein convertase family protein